MNEKEKIAVVGGGLAGLVAAYQLAKGGASVTLFEKSGALGGRAATVVKDGFSLNQGPHALYKAGIAYRFLSDIGAPAAGALPAAGRSLALYGGKLYDLPIDIRSLARTKMIRLSEKFELAMFFSRLPNTRLSEIMTTSLKAWLQAGFKSPRVSKIVESFARLSTYANNSEALSAGAAIRQLLLANQGPLYLHNGWAAIIHSLQSALGDSVQWRFNSRIREISQQDGAVEILFETGCERFDKVVLAVPPDVVNALVPGAIAPGIMDGIKSSHAACLDVCLKRLPVPERTFTLGIDEPLYYSVHSASAHLAPPGQALIHLAVYLKDGEAGGEEHKKRLFQLLDLLQPGWQNELVYERFLPHMTTSFGTATAALGGANGLLEPRLKSASGPGDIYVCGDWVGSGYLLADAAVDSALKISALIAGNRDLKSEGERKLIAK